MEIFVAFLHPRALYGSEQETIIQLTINDDGYRNAVLQTYKT